MITVHLLRHGEVDNPERVLYGTLPGFRLSDLGVAQAKLAAGRTADAAADLDLLKWDATKAGFAAIAKKTDEVRRQ